MFLHVPYSTLRAQDMAYSAILQLITLSFRSMALSSRRVPNGNGKMFDVRFRVSK